LANLNKLVGGRDAARGQ